MSPRSQGSCTLVEFFMEMLAIVTVILSMATVALLAQAAMGDVTEIDTILFVSHCPRSPGQERPLLTLIT
jgi:hypothetical protein